MTYRVFYADCVTAEVAARVQSLRDDQVSEQNVRSWRGSRVYSMLSMTCETGHTVSPLMRRKPRRAAWRFAKCLFVTTSSATASTKPIASCTSCPLCTGPDGASCECLQALAKTPRCVAPAPRGDRSGGVKRWWDRLPVCRRAVRPEATYRALPEWQASCPTYLNKPNAGALGRRPA